VITFDRDAGTTRNLALSKADLLEFDGWNVDAKRYLQAAPERIALLSVVTSYLDAVRAFYAWMLQRQADIHAADTAAVKAKQAMARKAMAADIPRLLAAGLDIFGKGVGRLQDIFGFALGPQDWVDLSSHEDNLSACVEAAGMSRRRLKFSEAANT